MKRKEKQNKNEKKRKTKQLKILPKFVEPSEKGEGPVLLAAFSLANIATALDIC